jgi:hypothetical protein
MMARAALALGDVGDVRALSREARALTAKMPMGTSPQAAG